MDKKHMENHLTDEALDAVSGGNDSSDFHVEIVFGPTKKTKNTPEPPTPELPTPESPTPIILPVKFEPTEPVEYKRTEPSPAASGLPPIYYKRRTDHG